MATTVGMALNAVRIYNISGQYDLRTRIPNDYDAFERINPRYGNIVPLLEEYKGAIYYFCPVGCGHDKEQLDFVQNIPCIRVFLFPDKIHAATVYPFNFPDLIVSDEKKMNRLYSEYKGKIINKKVFLIQTMSVKGWKAFISRMIKAKFRLIGLKELWNVKGDG